MRYSSPFSWSLSPSTWRLCSRSRFHWQPAPVFQVCFAIRLWPSVLTSVLIPLTTLLGKITSYIWVIRLWLKTGDQIFARNRNCCLNRWDLCRIFRTRVNILVKAPRNKSTFLENEYVRYHVANDGEYHSSGLIDCMTYNPGGDSPSGIESTVILIFTTGWAIWSDCWVGLTLICDDPWSCTPTWPFLPILKQPK